MKTLPIFCYLLLVIGLLACGEEEKELILEEGEILNELHAANIGRIAFMGDWKGGTYGYLFWKDTYTVNGQSYSAAHAAGNGGNHIFIFEELPYVIVITATAYGQVWAHAQVDQILENFILPAILKE